MAKKQEFDYNDIEDVLKRCSPPKKGNNVITCLARISFPNLQKPRANKKGDDAAKKKKYGVSLLIPPEFSIKLLKADVERAIDEKWGEKAPSKLKLPFLDAGDYEYEGYIRGWRLIRATCVTKPTVLDGLEHIKIVDEDDPAIYPGRWAQASIRAFAYDTDGNRGVAFGLNNIKLLHHDDAMGGRTRAEDEFDIDEEYEDMKSGKKSAFAEDDDDDRPAKKPASKRKAFDDEDEEDEKPRRPAAKRRVVEDDDDEEPRRPAKRRVVEDDDEEEERPRKKRPARRDDEDLD
jgi:hypothetical protein